MTEADPIAQPAQGTTCPLCGCGDAIRAELIPISLLRAVYRRSLGVDVGGDSGIETLAALRCRACDLGHFAPVLRAGASLYDLLQKQPWYYQDSKPEYDFAAGFVPPGGNVLEIGCGKGAFVAHIRPSRYVGLEFSPDAVAWARRAGLEVFESSVEEYAAACGEQFDSVVAFQVLEHVAQPRPFLESAKRMLRPGGRLIVSVPCDDSYVRYVQNGVLNLPPHHMTRWTGRCLRSVADVLGMDLVTVEHEVLSDAHCAAYATVVADVALARLLRQDRPSLDCRVTARFRRRAASLVARPLALALGSRDLRPRGHTITAVYAKRR